MEYHVSEVPHAIMCGHTVHTVEVPVLQPPNSSDGVRSKWELVDYDSDQDDECGHAHCV